MCGVCGAVDDARCDVTLGCVCSLCDVCVSVRVCTRSAPAVRASQVCRLNISLIPTLIPHSRPPSTDRRTSRSTTGRTSVSAHGYDMIMHTMRRGSFLWLRTPPQLSLHAHRALSGVRQLSQHPPRSAAALQTCISLCASATAQAHNDEATRRRAPRRAALSTARHAQLMRSIGSEQHLRVLHSLITRAPPLERSAPSGATVTTDEQLRPTTAHVCTACSALIDVAAGLSPDVENPTSGGDLGPSGSTLGPPSVPMERRNNFVLVFAPWRITTAGRRGVQ